MGVQIIAEAGSNHNGNIEYAYKLVDIAKESGADVVKFQIINPEKLYVPYYWKDNQKIPNKVFKRREDEKMEYSDWKNVKKYCDDQGIQFAASAFDKEGVDFLNELGVPFIKLASSDLNNIPLIRYVASKKIKTIISTGMAKFDEISASVEEFEKIAGTLELLQVMHCVSSYPCSLSNAGLNKIDKLKQKFTCEIGYSDHTQSSVAAGIAVSKGVNALEKHFTFDQSLDGFDHMYASNPEQFKQYCSDVKEIEKDLNSKDEVQANEKVTAQRARRSVYPKRKINKGEIIKEDDLVVLRPAGKLKPNDVYKIIGLKAAEDLREFEAIEIRDDFLYKDPNTVWEKANKFWLTEMEQKKMK